MRGCVGGMYVRAIMRACLLLRVVRLEVVDKLRFDIGRANRHGRASPLQKQAVGCLLDLACVILIAEELPLLSVPPITLRWHLVDPSPNVPSASPLRKV